MLKKHAGKLFVAVAVLLLGGSFLLSKTANQNADEGVVISDKIKGNSEAQVVLVEYSDFQCPACAQFYPIVKEIVEEYSDDIRFEYKHFPLISIHALAVPAARAAEAAGQQGKFFEMHDKLFDNQRAWSNAANPNPYFISYAEEIGLDVETFKRHMRSALIDQRIEEQFGEARELGLSGTPSFYLNGQRMQFETLGDFRDQIVAEITGGELPQTEEVEVSTEPEIKFGI